MAAVGRSTVPQPDVIIALGNNFYPNGIKSPEQWDMWRGFFPLAHPDGQGLGFCCCQGLDGGHPPGPQGIH